MMITQGEIEAAICKGITRVRTGNAGDGVRKTIEAFLINDFIVVRLQRVVGTTAEQQLGKMSLGEGAHLAQGSADPPDRNSEAAAASAGRGNHGRAGCEPAS